MKNENAIMALATEIWGDCQPHRSIDFWNYVKTQSDPKLGISKTDVYNFIRKQHYDGWLARVKYGIFQLAEAVPPDADIPRVPKSITHEKKKSRKKDTMLHYNRPSQLLHRIEEVLSAGMDLSDADDIELGLAQKVIDILHTCKDIPIKSPASATNDTAIPDAAL